MGIWDIATRRAPAPEAQSLRIPMLRARPPAFTPMLGGLCTRLARRVAAWHFSPSNPYGTQIRSYTKTNNDYVESYGCEELSRRSSLIAEMASTHKTAEILEAANRDLAGMREQMPAKLRQDLGARHEATAPGAIVFRRKDCGDARLSHGGSPAWASMASAWREGCGVV